MGLGGYLTWTAVAREIKSKIPEVKLLPVEQKGYFLKIIDSEVFHNNEDFLSYESKDYKDQLIFPLILNSEGANYCIDDTPEKAHHRSDVHIINHICEFFGLESPELKCILNLTDKEKEFAEKFHKSINNKKFITIEPFSKDNYTPNRAYPFEKWQSIVNNLSNSITVVQVGNSDRVLDNVIDMTGKTSFREALSLIQKSELFVASESGLVHGATAVETKSVVVITGYQDSRMVSYPQNINIDISTHGPCGLKISCEKCIKDANDHDENKILDAINKETCL